MSMYAVRQIKALNHLYCKRHKRFKRTTNSDHNRAMMCAEKQEVLTW